MKVLLLLVFLIAAGKVNAKPEKFMLTKNFLMNNDWYFQVGSTSGDRHQWIILNPNGKVYLSDNKTLYYSNAHWAYNDGHQVVDIHWDSLYCAFNAVIANYNPTYYPDVELVGNRLSTAGNNNILPCSLSLGLPDSVRGQFKKNVETLEE